MSIKATYMYMYPVQADSAWLKSVEKHWKVCSYSLKSKYSPTLTLIIWTPLLQNVSEHLHVVQCIIYKGIKNNWLHAGSKRNEKKIILLFAKRALD